MNKLLTFALAAFLTLPGVSNAKKVLDHSSFDNWKSVKNFPLSNSGEWAAFQVFPQEGDAMLTFRNTKSGKEIMLARGYKPCFTADSKWAVALIKPFFKDTRKAKIKKKKGFDLPQDSLAIVNLVSGKVEKIASVISYKIGKDGGGWIAYQSCDTALIKPKALKDKDAGKPLVIRNLTNGSTKVVKWVKDYALAKDGSKVAMSLRKQKRDTVATDGMGVIMLPDTAFTLIDRDKKFYGAPVFSQKGDMLAYTASNDSAKTGTKIAQLFLVKFDSELFRPQEIKVDFNENEAVNLMIPNAENPALKKQAEEEWRRAIKSSMGGKLFINQYSAPVFSHNGKRLIIGIAPYIAPDDTTIIDFEQASLDIWRWDAPYTPPQEKTNLSKLRKQTLPVVYDIESEDMILLTRNKLTVVEPSDRWDGDWALLRDPSKDIISQQWNYTAPEQLSVKNVITGQEKYIGSAPASFSEISKAGKYVVWFDDRNYYSYEIATGTTRKISGEIRYPLWNEDQDIPMIPTPYGVAGWADNDTELYVYDRHDIWALDPKGQKAPYCLTDGMGRKENRRYRIMVTDREKRFFKTGDELLLSVFDYTDKRNGLAILKFVLKPVKPSIKVIDKYKFTQITKAKNAQVYSWQRANFNTSPDIWISSSTDFAKAKIVSDANPQMKDYNWGTAELVKWYAYNGKLTEGVLYTPEDFDPNKKYPMLVVFYETNSEELYRHYTMEPSWSWVNYPFYVSRGYIIFVPDVHYTPGIPGESAYNYICSGVEELCKQCPWIDKTKIGIDGQSWGGYQTAFLVTRTNMFACAGSGAPVSNMTSAFGGIRWGSGDSRQAQYEVGQSRIGRNLWEAPELYIANSPIFKADRVQTPLLIMHNDNDGAVPWYQGIEMFMALRRLQKPVWMLQYNGEAHNIRERKNRKDITIRLQQFFDHYLKGAPEPKWMKEGIPALRKGQEMNTGLVAE